MTPSKKCSPGKLKVREEHQSPAVQNGLFRKTDWATALFTFLIIGVVYLFTLAPEVTLEDSGELVTGSYYAGIPHPPGYPVWTIYSWLWTVLVPFGNVAWRVALAEAAAGAVSCAMIALMVSRGSSLLLQGATRAKPLPVHWDRTLCVVAGCAAGLMQGLDAFMWRESVAVNRIAVSSVPWFLLMLLFLFRWLYIPQQKKYLYLALFIFGICFTTHQSLIVAAIGVEVLIALRCPALGRDILFGNGIIYLIYNLIVLSTGQHLFHNLGAKPGLLLLFHGIGLASLITSGWLTLRSKSLLSEWRSTLILGLLWLAGASFYFYLPLSCMTNPPMQWCYPRTVDGFIHALSRGQYEQPNPTNLLTESGRFIGQLGMLLEGVADSFTWVGLLIALVPFIFLKKAPLRERAWLIGLASIYFCLGILLLILLNPTPDRSSADLVKVFFNASHTVVATLLGYGIALTAAFMASQYQSFRRWGLVGGLVAAVLACVNLQSAVGKHFFGPAGQVDLADLPHWIGCAFNSNQYGLPIYANLLLVGMAFIFVCSLLVYRRRAPLAIALTTFVALPVYSGLSHWFECDQRGHYFGYWFGHDMFNPPFKDKNGERLFPEITRNAVLFGGTDPGRFCPTYMVFCESFIPHSCQPPEDQAFDRRDVYVITQNALVDPPYLNYIRAHYNRSAQVDPPFFSELCRSIFGDKDYQTNRLARLLAPVDRVLASLGDRVEKRRRTFTSWFTPTDFIDLPTFASKLRPDTCPDPLSRYLYESLSVRTQQMLTAKSEERLLRRELAADLNKLLGREVQTRQLILKLETEKSALDEAVFGGDVSERQKRKQAMVLQELEKLSRIGALYDPERFRQVTLSDYLKEFLNQNPQGHTRIRLNRLLLEAAYPHEIARSLGGIYPDRQIFTPSFEDSQRCVQFYLQDAQRRMQLNQLRPGEELKVVDDRISVTGQGGIMGINGAIAKVIFDRNPTLDFFVEESLPLEWMYPHLTPSGIIMKVNRQPISPLPEDILRRDHEFWSQYSNRLTGDIFHNQFSTQDLTKWVEKTYLRRDFNGFSGDRKFVHDLDAQKSFSKLRCAIGGIYTWRLSPQCPAEYRPRTETEFRNLLSEAEFAFSQAFAFCPYNAEAAYRYANILLQLNRLEDALLVARAFLKFDPFSPQAESLITGLENLRRQQSGA